MTISVPTVLQAVDADTQKAMLSWYYKKQEEQKVRACKCGTSCLPLLWHGVIRPRPRRVPPPTALPLPTTKQALAENDDDSYTHSVWANSKSLKQHFAGVGDLRIR